MRQSLQVVPCQRNASAEEIIPTAGAYDGISCASASKTVVYAGLYPTAVTAMDELRMETTLVIQVCSGRALRCQDLMDCALCRCRFTGTSQRLGLTLRRDCCTCFMRCLEANIIDCLLVSGLITTVHWILITALYGRRGCSSQRR